jgi:hypothetical protein
MKPHPALAFCARKSRAQAVSAGSKKTLRSEPALDPNGGVFARFAFDFERE